MADYYLGGTGRIWIEYRDRDTNTLTSPTTSTKLTLKDPEGTKKVDAGSCTESSTGKLYYDYAFQSTDLVGKWRGYFMATSGSITQPTIIECEVEDLP